GAPSSTYLDFSPGPAKAFLYPRAGYVPKPVVLQAFCPPPFQEPDQQKLNCMCPVRALDICLSAMVPLRRVFLHLNRPSAAG
ncbi:hypothetical protein M9458_021497, partial [Cirrhinus mrigala]